MSCYSFLFYVVLVNGSPGKKRISIDSSRIYSGLFLAWSVTIFVVLKSIGFLGLIRLHPDLWRFAAEAQPFWKTLWKTMVNDLIVSDKLTHQSAISFGHITKTSHNLTCNITVLMKKSPGDFLAKWSKLLHQMTWQLIKTGLKEESGRRRR